MTRDDDLSRFVRNALRDGQTPDAIRTALQSAGWTAPEIDAALSGWTVIDGSGPVPRPLRSREARNALFYALLFVVLGMVAGNTLSLLFGQINLWMPEPGDIRSYGRLTGLRWSMAALIVFLPVFWLLDRTDSRATRSDPSRKHGTMRRWLSALAMLIAVITLLGDALYLIYTWLDGQVTPRFLVKSATVALLALIVLAYFREDRGLPIRAVPVPAAAGLIALGAIALGLSFWTIGGPGQGRMEQRDRWRISDMQILARDVAACAAVDRNDLPDTLDPMTCARNPANLTGYASELRYTRITATEFELCTEVEFPPAVADWSLRIDGTTACLSTRTD